VIVAGMNLMGYDAMAIGPRELSLGLETLRRRMVEAAFPMLSANVVLEADGELLAAPYTILPVAGQRVALLGLTRPPEELLPDFRVLDPLETALQYVPELAQQAETIIILTNLDFRSAWALAEAVPGIALVVAGLPQNMPDRAARTATNGTLVVAADPPAPGHTARWLGRLAVNLDGDGGLTGESWLAVPLDNGVPDDPDMQALLGRYVQ
jgi:2',3'-cyclic-nucleotide 2'-phosphodiesterase (5'-nucleotidase family)